MELLQVYGKNIGLVLGANANEGISYKRYASQASWKRIRGSVMAYQLATEVVLSDKKVARKEKKRKKQGAQDKTVSGGVFFQGKPLKDVTIINLNSLQKTSTDANGRYLLRAIAGDVLEFSHPKMDNVLKEVTQKPFINASMQQHTP